MTVKSKHVRFAKKDTVHQLPTPSPTHSLPSLSSSGGPATPPDLPAVLPGPTPYQFTLPPYAQPKMYYGPPQLHPTLAGPHAAIRWDFVYSPSTLAVASRGISLQFYAEPASHPPVASMTITSPHLPWRIVVTPSRRGPITVSDVLYAIHDTLRKNIHASEFELLSSSDKKRVRRAYEDRYRNMRASGARDAEEEKRQGVKRVDFVMGKTRFMGLSPTNNPAVWGLISA